MGHQVRDPDLVAARPAVVKVVAAALATTADRGKGKAVVVLALPKDKPRICARLAELKLQTAARCPRLHPVGFAADHNKGQSDLPNKKTRPGRVFLFVEPPRERQFNAMNYFEAASEAAAAFLAALAL